MKRFTVLFLLFAYLFGAVLTLADSNGNDSFEVVTTPDVENTITAEDVGWTDMITNAFNGFKGALSTVFNILKLSFKPLSDEYSTGIAFIDAVFKTFWTVALTISYLDISKDIISVLSKIMQGIGSLIPFT